MQRMRCIKAGISLVTQSRPTPTSATDSTKSMPAPAEATLTPVGLGAWAGVTARPSRLTPSSSRAARHHPENCPRYPAQAPPRHRQQECCHDNANKEHLSEVPPAFPFTHVPPRLLPMGSVVALTNPLHRSIRRCAAVVVSAAVREPCGSLKSRELPGGRQAYRLLVILGEPCPHRARHGRGPIVTRIVHTHSPTMIQSRHSLLQGRSCPGPASSRTKGISHPTRR